MPEVDVQSMLHQHEAPIMHDTHRSPPLILIFVSKTRQTVVRRLSLCLAKMLSGANAFRISEHQLNPR
jgi:hypothetical protein